MPVHKIKYRLPALFTLFALLFGLSGCGPGFPIMTAEQESMTTNVDRLVKENEELKKRLLALEGGAVAGAEIDGVRRTLAELNSSVEQLRQEFSVMRGAAEETDHEKGQMKEDVRSASASLKSVNERLAQIDGALKENDRKIGEIKASIDAMDKRVLGTEDSVAAVEKRASALEARPNEHKNGDGNGSSIDPDALYLRGYNETKNKDYQKAAETFQSFLSEFPEHKLAGHAQYWLGEIYYAKGDWERAILEFDKVIKKYPKGGKAAAATLKEGLSFERLGSIKEARVLLGEVVEKYPKSQEAGMAKKRLDALKRK